MSDTYHEIMEHIEIDPKMRERILEHISQADLTAGGVSQTDDKLCAHKERGIKGTPFSRWRRYAGLAAAVALFAVVCAVLPTLITRDPAPDHAVTDQPGEDEVQGGWAYEEYADIAELSAQAGYELHDVTGLPFEPQSTTYALIGTDLAQIQYQSEDAWACYRKSPGTEENSGDYNEYTVVDTISVGDCQVELRGGETGYVLAVWTQIEDGGDYACSLSLSQAQPEDVWIQLLADTVAGHT